jgi:hypothetical protein
LLLDEGNRHPTQARRNQNLVFRPEVGMLD